MPYCFHTGCSPGQQGEMRGRFKAMIARASLRRSLPLNVHDAKIRLDLFGLTFPLC